MISVLSGIIVSGAGSATLWYCLPRGGQAHPLLKRPLLDSTIPIVIVSCLSIGIALIISGLVG